ncbi:MAG: D-3-phosphoglycerate dehydrogenase [Myxococcales bacterium]|nr:D-3-phosphoglycerate dehydrogenase [Myxococcales bacterium]MBL0198011.1 D-3-phosphoglycerate dehydrogenase [Myxococcales bacterium]HQY64339.1 NAD(P)-dependent oxidoreductase [Polyangiaceae bacterium]
MRLLIADKLHPRAVEELRTLPIEVVYEPELTKETLETTIRDVGILVVRSKEVTAKAIEGARQLNLIVRAGTEAHNIDIRAASKGGVYVANCPGKNAGAVAELVLGQIIALDRRIPDAVLSLRNQRWERSEYGKAEGIAGKTIGIAGFGAVGREVARMALAFGLRPLAWSRGLSPQAAAEAGVGHVKTIEELASKSDILTLHLPVNDRTRQLVNKRVLDLLPRRAMLINVARADLVDYAALREAVKGRGLRAAVDVYPDEPKGKREFATDLFEAAPSATGGFVYGTPHIAASTDQAQLAIATETVRVIRSFLVDGNVPNCLNVSHVRVARFQLVIRMLDKVGTLANVLSVIKRHGINIEEVTNTVFEHAEASSTKLRLLSRPSETCLSEIRAFDEILHLDLVTLPYLA